MKVGYLSSVLLNDPMECPQNKNNPVDFLKYFQQYFQSEQVLLKKDQ